MSRADHRAIVAAFAPDAVLSFSGTHALGGTFRGREQISKWFEQLFAYLPGLKLVPQTIVVDGHPWNTSVATWFRVTATLSDGTPYENEGMQFLRIRWGRIVEDRLFEDTQLLARALSTRTS